MTSRPTAMTRRVFPAVPTVGASVGLREAGALGCAGDASAIAALCETESPDPDAAWLMPGAGPLDATGGASATGGPVGIGAAGGVIEAAVAGSVGAAGCGAAAAAAAAAAAGCEAATPIGSFPTGGTAPVS